MNNNTQTLEIQGGRLRFYVPSKARTAPTSHLRGKITGFSSASRLRLMRFFASVDWDFYEGDVLFLTLTSPPEVWGDLARLRAALDKFRRTLPSLLLTDSFGAIVRREIGAGGMHHYHLIICGARYLPALQLREVWGSCLGLSYPVRVGVQSADGPTVSRYLCKYLGKVQPPRTAPHPQGAGGGVTLSKSHNATARTGTRNWYVWGNLQMAEIKQVTADDLRVLATRIRRIFRAWVRAKTKERLAKNIKKQTKLTGAAFTKEVARRFGKLRAGGRFRWLSRPGGFTLLAGSTVLWQCLWAASD